MLRYWRITNNDYTVRVLWIKDTQMLKLYQFYCRKSL